MSQVTRSSERISANLLTTVKFKGINNEVWKENTRTISFSRNGAGFLLQHKCHIGRLLSIIIPLPKHLRCYDKDKEFYRIWGLVQHCNQVVTENFSGYHIGVAFVGKDAPAGYHENPAAYYKICGMNEDGLWAVVKTGKPFIVRKYPRFWISLDVLLEPPEVAGEDDFAKEKTVTENISVSGAAVFSNLNVEPNDCVNFICKEHDFSALARVCYKNTEDDERPKIHLEFINAKFPVEKLVFSVETEVKN